MSMPNRPFLCNLLAAVLMTVGFGASSSPEVPAVRYPLIVRLESRHYSIDISAGPRHPVYSVKGPDGRLLCRNLPLSNLRASHRNLFNLLAPAQAPITSEAGSITVADLQ